MSREHLLAYYKWDDRTHWKLDSMKREVNGKPIIAYVSYEENLFPLHARPGNTLWVIGLGPDKTPTLEAKITIAKAHPQGKGVRVEGSPSGSMFFGLNDASEAVMKLVFTSEKQTWSLRERAGSTIWIPRHGISLRAPRRIAAVNVRTDQDGYRSTGIVPLTTLARQAQKKSIFISWKHKDHSPRSERFLQKLAIALTKRGYSVWLDRLVLADAERIQRQKNKRELMTKLLHQGMTGCKLVVGVWTDNYGEPSKKEGENWTLNEWQGFRGVQRVALYPGETFAGKKKLRPPKARVPMPENPSPADAELVARRLGRECGKLLKSRA